MLRMTSALVIGMLAASLSGCQLIEALLLDGAERLPREGTCATYEVVATDEQPVTPEILDQTRTIIENRIEATGVADAAVHADDDGLLRIGVPLFGPESETAQEIRNLIGTTGVLEFIPVPAQYFDDSLQDQPLPEGMLDVEPLFTGVEIDSAATGQDQTTGEIVVNLQLKETGARLFDEHAEEHLGERFAIVLDGIIESAPSINATRFGGRAQISGNFTPAEANNLVTVLKFGSLPLEIREVGYGACEVLLGGSGLPAAGQDADTAMLPSPLTKEDAVARVLSVDPRFADLPDSYDLWREGSANWKPLMLLSSYYRDLTTRSGLMTMMEHYGVAPKTPSSRLVEVTFVRDCEEFEGPGPGFDFDTMPLFDDPCEWRHSWFYRVQPDDTVTLLFDEGDPGEPPAQDADTVLLPSPLAKEDAVARVLSLDTRFADLPDSYDLWHESVANFSSVVLENSYYRDLTTIAGPMTMMEFYWVAPKTPLGRLVEVTLVRDCEESELGPSVTGVDTMPFFDDPCEWRHSWFYRVQPDGTVTLLFDEGDPGEPPA